MNNKLPFALARATCPKFLDWSYRAAIENSRGNICAQCPNLRVHRPVDSWNEEMFCPYAYEQGPTLIFHHY